MPSSPPLNQTSWSKLPCRWLLQPKQQAKKTRRKPKVCQRIRSSNQIWPRPWMALCKRRCRHQPLHSHFSKSLEAQPSIASGQKKPVLESMPEFAIIVGNVVASDVPEQNSEGRSARRAGSGSRSPRREVKAILPAPTSPALDDLLRLPSDEPLAKAVNRNSDQDSVHSRRSSNGSARSRRSHSPTQPIQAPGHFTAIANELEAQVQAAANATPTA